MSLKFLSVDDVCGLFPPDRMRRGGHRRTMTPDQVYKALDSGELVGKKVGNHWWTTETAVERWISSGNPAANKD